jgi:membrane protease YdiL (CAAX protease family)
VASLVLAGVLWVGVFYPLTQLGLELEIDFTQLGTFDLFFLHGLLALCLALWYTAGFVGVPLSAANRLAAAPTVQFGLRTDRWSKELAIGALFGLGAWAVVVGILLCLGTLLWLIGGSEAFPENPPELMVWIAGLPIGVRIALSVSAGFFEEVFFRGFLQPRMGIVLSTILFVLAHVSYAQPLMLVGVTLLSLVFAYLVRWRQSIWAAIAAHAIFDAIQLLIVIPAVLKFTESDGGSTMLLHVIQSSRF